MVVSADTVCVWMSPSPFIVAEDWGRSICRRHHALRLACPSWSTKQIASHRRALAGGSPSTKSSVSVAKDDRRSKLSSCYMKTSQSPVLDAPTVRGETWTDPLGGDPSGCRLIEGIKELRA
jgi:hypothetical protein